MHKFHERAHAFRRYPPQIGDVDEIRTYLAVAYLEGPIMGVYFTLCLLNKYVLLLQRKCLHYYTACTVELVVAPIVLSQMTFMEPYWS